MDRELETVEGIVGRVGNDFGRDAWNGLQGAEPKIEGLPFAPADARLIAFLPGLERRHHPGNALLAHFHAAASAAVLPIGGAHQILAPGDNAGRRAAEELMTGIDDDIGTLPEKTL